MVKTTAERTVVFIEDVKARHIDLFLRYGTGTINIRKLADIFAEVVSECDFVPDLAADSFYELKWTDFNFIMSEFAKYMNAVTSKN